MLRIWAAGTIVVGAVLAVVSACSSSGSGGGSGAAAGSSGSGAAGGNGGNGGSSDGGCHPDPPPLVEPLVCGSTTCVAGQICVHPCCGGAPLDGEACKPAPPYCVDAALIECTGCDSATPTNCTYGFECQGVMNNAHNLACLCA